MWAFLFGAPKVNDYVPPLFLILLILACTAFFISSLNGLSWLWKYLMRVDAATPVRIAISSFVLDPDSARTSIARTV